MVQRYCGRLRGLPAVRGRCVIAELRRDVVWSCCKRNEFRVETRVKRLRAHNIHQVGGSDGDDGRGRAAGVHAAASHIQVAL